MGKEDTTAPSGAISSLNTIIRAEITEETERQRCLYASGTSGRVTLFILGLAILVNIIYFFRSPAYPLILITASFFLFMFYFITLLIPHTLKPTASPQNELRKYVTGFRETGFIRSTTRFTRIFLNAFFINCRPLFFGFSLLFSLDIVLMLLLYHTGTLSTSHTGIVLFQSAAIIIFYFLVWKLEPYSTEFFSDVSDVKDHLVKRHIPESVVSFLFLAGTALALICIISTIILLPGVTVNNVLSVSEFNELGHLIIAIATALVPLYFIFRYIHGITSRDLLLKFSQNKTEHLLQQADRIKGAGADATTPGAGSISEEALFNATELLLEAQIYQVEKKTIFGTFPVYIVNPDFHKVFSRRDFSGGKDRSV
ncbi:MAG: hypothetical protein WC362_02695 [Methanoregula sp.]